MSPEENNEVIPDNAWWVRGVGGKRADLRGADLSGADLKGADLMHAKLTDANLKGADLNGANLGGANLRGARLTHSDLSGAIMDGADLSCAKCAHADLRVASLINARLTGAMLGGAKLADAILNGAVGNMKEIRSLQIEEWPIAYTADRIQIGCENHSIAEWRSFSDEEISKMDEDALRWWRRWKEPLLNIIELSPATPTGHEEGAA